MREQLGAIQPHLDELRQKQEERMRQFSDVKAHISKITTEILGNNLNDAVNEYSPAAEEDLSLKRLDEYTSQLQALQKEKVRTHIYFKFSFSQLDYVKSILLLNLPLTIFMVHMIPSFLFPPRVNVCTKFWIM